MTTTATQVRERPIIFSAPMVRAILDGRKTMTRRIVKPQPDGFHHSSGLPAVMQGAFAKEIRCPYGNVGERLWVKENVAGDPHNAVSRVHYFATDGELTIEQRHDAGLLNRYSARYCPRWASRITLEITGVKVERVQDISEDDARAEGVEPASVSIGEWMGPSKLPTKKIGRNKLTVLPYSLGFMRLWDSINGKGSWDSNPWVWCIEFRRV